jgi:hypothetical protein
VGNGMPRRGRGMERIQVQKVTKADKARRRRAERIELHQLREFRQRAETGGAEIQTLLLNEVSHERINVAQRLGFAVVLRPDFSRQGERTWRVIAVKK